MFNPQGKLLVIHQYPTPCLQPFLNPICKDTYNSLPKIYGHKNKKRYLMVPHTLKHSIEEKRCLRECCTHQYEELYSSRTDLKELRKARVNRLINQAASSAANQRKSTSFNEFSDKRQKTRRKETFHGKIMPSLKIFKNEQLNEVETKHKVHRPIALNSLDIHSVSEPQGNNMNLVDKKVRNKLKSAYSSSNESVQTQEKYFPSISMSKQQEYQRVKTQTDRVGRYQYVQNSQKQKKSKQNTELRNSLKTSNLSLDQYSLSSTAMRQSKDSTMFHKCKQVRLNPNTQAVLSNGLFKIPQEAQFSSYLLNYQPMSLTFNLRNIVKSPNFHILPSQGRVYFGQLVDHKRHGKGITVSEKEIYQGDYNEDMKVQGCEKNRDGVYIGQFLRNKRHGQGKFLWVNGEMFEGEWRQGKKQGFGIWTSPKGDFYQGQWMDNRQNGQGYFVHHGGTKYKGSFKNFLKQGRGHEEFLNGDHYIGQYALGKPHGEGKYAWANGDSYEGSFQEGSRSGYGLLKKKNGQIYEGCFKNDLKHGQAKQYYKSGQYFQGHYSQGERGKGRLKTRTGAVIQITQ